MCSCAVVPSLLQICLDQLASSIHRVTSLSGVPEELCSALLAAVVAKGKLTPAVVQLFSAAGASPSVGALWTVRGLGAARSRLLLLHRCLSHCAAAASCAVDVHGW
jgi:hypothetical protein